MTNARGRDCCTTGGQDGQKRLEFWWDCLQNGTLPPDQNPIGWDFKSGELPRCPPWKNGVGVGVKTPEGGLGPGVATVTPAAYVCLTTHAK